MFSLLFKRRTVDVIFGEGYAGMKRNIKRSLGINVKVYTLGYKQPSATTLTWQMSSPLSGRRNANVQLIVRSFTVRVSALLSLSLFEREWNVGVNRN